MLDQVRRQHPPEAAGLRVLGFRKLGTGQGGQPAFAADLDRVLVVVHAHAVGREVREVAPPRARDNNGPDNRGD